MQFHLPHRGIQNKTIKNDFYPVLASVQIVHVAPSSGDRVSAPRQGHRANDLLTFAAHCCRRS